MQGVRTFDEFRSSHGFDLEWPCTHQHLLHFAAKMSLDGKSTSSVRTYLAGIAAKHKLNGWEDPTDNWLLTKLLQGMQKTKKTTDHRCPITFSKLELILQILPTICSNTYETNLFAAAYSVAFFGFFRISELLGQENIHGQGRSPILLQHIQLSDNLVMHLSGSKTDQTFSGAQIVIDPVHTNPGVCPVRCMRSYLNMRSKTDGALFIHFGGNKLTRYQFHAVLKKCVARLGWLLGNFASHSFRIGAATTAAMNGVPLNVIMGKGRWKTVVAKRYIRVDKV